MVPCIQLTTQCHVCDKGGADGGAEKTGTLRLPPGADRSRSQVLFGLSGVTQDGTEAVWLLVFTWGSLSTRAPLRGRRCSQLLKSTLGQMKTELDAAGVSGGLPEIFSNTCRGSLKHSFGHTGARLAHRIDPAQGGRVGILISSHSHMQSSEFMLCCFSCLHHLFGESL